MHTPKTKATEIPIFFSVDDRYLPFLAVSMRSMIDNASPDYFYRIHILNMGLDPARLAKVTEMERENVKIVPIDVSRQIEPLMKRLNLRDYYTVSIYYRLFISSMFPQYDKAIYLDADITVNGDISELYRTPLGDNLLGVIRDAVAASDPTFRDYTQRTLGIPYREYFNSGVLLMNLKEFRKQEIERRFVSLLQTFHFETIAPDQDYLNFLCHGKVLYLDPTWNRMTVGETEEGTPKLIHYNMFRKPWLCRNVRYRKFFWEYAEKTAFYEEIREIQNRFGARERLADRKAGEALLLKARQIADSEGNFHRILNCGTTASPRAARFAKAEACV